MNRSTTFHGLRFERGPGRFPRRLILPLVTVPVFVLLWWLVPPSILFWFLLVSTVTLVWAASYGWRQAVATLITLLHRLEES